MVPTLARSATDLMFFGLPGFTAICIWLRANGVGVVVTWPPLTSLSMLVRSADAYTSAGAPPWIWVTSADDDPKLNVTVALGFFLWKPEPSLVNASVSDAAADTVMDPEVLALDRAAPAGAAVSAARTTMTTRASRERRMRGNGVLR